MNEKKITEILKTVHTPLYVFDLCELKRRVQFIREQLPERVELCYAVKANPFVLETFAEIADWLEICSPGELGICEELELPREKFIISGVHKDADLLERLISAENEVGYYTAESCAQFTLLRETAKRHQKKISLILRLTSGNQFGLDDNELLEIVGRHQNDQWIDICGLQFFSGTQKTSVKKLAREIRKLDDFLADLYQAYYFRMPKLEFGPGFPVAYFPEESFNETEFLRIFSELLSDMRYDGPISLELGRSLTASCGTYLTRIVDIKKNHGQNYAIVDGGIHQLVYYGQSMAMKQPCFSVLPNHEEINAQEWNICGSLCTVNDYLVKRTKLSGLQKGDVLAFERAGAYCMTEGISLFLSRDLPQIVLLNTDGTYSAVRRKTSIFELNTPQYEKETVKNERKID